ncbi:MAG: NADP-dependent malic enzyme [Candidatus Melainabacteria bacterium]|nr:NADP-dependent malic enzyme [Candidatus Melainabacteria bacterium]
MDLRRCYQGVIVTQSSFQTLTDEIYDAIHSPPQAALPSQLIQAEPDRVYDLTAKSNLVAVITDGSAVLGLGNIGPAAGLPVMEGKSVLFKTFGGVEAFPICLRTQDVDEFVEAVKRIAPSFGGINLEDIAAPRCFEIEKRLIAETDIPIFHDDQHGTAIVTVAAVLNAVQAVGKQMNEVRVAVSGAGAAALSVSQLLLQCGIRDILICDRQGVIYQGREEGMNPFKESIAQVTNLTGFRGTLAQAMREADIFIGLSAPGMVTGEMVRSMAKDPIILAMANPKPEIMPDEARAAGAKIIATGRSDFPNQVNNCLAFPGLFRGVLDVRARLITDDLKLAAARAIAQLITEAELSRGIIIPGALDYRVPPAVAQAVAQAAIETGVARCPVPAEQVAASLKQFILEGSLASLVSGAVVSGAV